MLDLRQTYPVNSRSQPEQRLGRRPSHRRDIATSTGPKGQRVSVWVSASDWSSACPVHCRSSPASSDAPAPEPSSLRPAEVCIVCNQSSQSSNEYESSWISIGVTDGRPDCVEACLTCARDRIREMDGSRKRLSEWESKRSRSRSRSSNAPVDSLKSTSSASCPPGITREKP